jgi:hypothetical protein
MLLAGAARWYVTHEVCLARSIILPDRRAVLRVNSAVCVLLQLAPSLRLLPHEG